MESVDWSPLLQTALGAAVVLVANHLVHRHRVSESMFDARRELYVRYGRHLFRAHRLFGPGDRSRTAPEDEVELGRELDDLLAEIQLVASKKVREAAHELHDAISDAAAEFALHEEHQEEAYRVLNGPLGEAVFKAMRKELGEF